VDLPCTADCGGNGGTRWSKKPSFSSYVMNRAVRLHTSGPEVSASRTGEIYQAP
jgi:hypothetical protein